MTSHTGSSTGSQLASHPGHAHPHPGHPHSTLAAPFYAQNVAMMSSWRAYDSAGFQRASPYGKFLFKLNSKHVFMYIVQDPIENRDDLVCKV